MEEIDLKLSEEDKQRLNEYKRNIGKKKKST